MKHVNTIPDLQGFARYKTYRCNKCGTEVTKLAEDTSDISCKYCKEVVPFNEIEKEKTND